MPTMRRLWVPTGELWGRWWGTRADSTRHYPTPNEQKNPLICINRGFREFRQCPRKGSQFLPFLLRFLAVGGLCGGDGGAIRLGRPADCLAFT